MSAPLRVLFLPLLAGLALASPGLAGPPSKPQAPPLRLGPQGLAQLPPGTPMELSALKRAFEGFVVADSSEQEGELHLPKYVVLRNKVPLLEIHPNATCPKAAPRICQPAAGLRRIRVVSADVFVPPGPQMGGSAVALLHPGRGCAREGGPGSPGVRCPLASGATLRYALELPEPQGLGAPRVAGISWVPPTGEWAGSPR